MLINVVTIDFWNTLFDASNSAPRNAARKKALMTALLECGHECTDEQFEAAYKGIWDYFDHHWLNHHRTPTSDEMIREIVRKLEGELDDVVVQEVAVEYERGIIEHPPALLPGVPEALEYLSGRAKLALISDTAFSPGLVLREVMRNAGIERYFSEFVFSNETGFAKPHAEAFRLALEPFGGNAEAAAHIGDLERTDVKGAKTAGMKAILYRGDEPHKHAEEETQADSIMHHWNEIERIIDELG